MFAVAPVWERGLKYTAHSTGGPEPRRSRLGAWIEISLLFIVYLPGFVAPVWGRGLKL